MEKAARGESFYLHDDARPPTHSHPPPHTHTHDTHYDRQETHTRTPTQGAVGSFTHAAPRRG